MKQSVFTILLAAFTLVTANAQVIEIDADFGDWEGKEPIFVDQLNDGQNNGIDFERVWAYNDEKYLFFRFETNKEIDLQEDNELAIYIDYDNNINTGFKINGVGAEVRYFFGERFGVISEDGDNEFINFVPVDMNVAPTVTGTQFELAFLRDVSESGVNFSAQPTIQFRIEDNSFLGDEAPDDLAGIKYTLDQSIVSVYPDVDLSQSSASDFRFLTYNIERDQLFESGRRQYFDRIFKAINPQVIALQEVRDFDSEETMERIQEFLPGEWFHKKHGFDIVTVSRYPIIFSEFLDGNGAFYLDVDGQEVLLINCHLPCCENDNGRQGEVDAIMEYVRNLKNGQGNFQVQEDIPIIIAGDMNFVGNDDQPNTLITGDIFNNGQYGPDFLPDWDDTEFKDVAAQATNAISNITWINPNGSFFPGKLDWIVYSDSRMSFDNAFNLYTPAMTSAQLSQYDLRSNDVLNAADHLPCVADFSFMAVNTKEEVQIEASVYPNPVSDDLYIDSDQEELVDLKIISKEGKIVMWQALTSGETNVVDIRSLPHGIHYVVIRSKNGRKVESIVVR